jgi:hypothetical protein
MEVALALRSITFKDDGALQQCLLLDSAHVVPGATGLHVARIQSALLLLDRAAISTAELRSKSYGPTTTAAVLAFKRKRNIINTSYQTQADDIVGKMTIARLDDEILAVEGRITSRVVCGTNGAVGARSLSIASPASAVTAGKNAPPKLNQLLRVVYQATSTAEALGGLVQLPALIRRARVLMAPHALDFADTVARIGPVIPHDLLVDVHFNSEAFALRQKSIAVMPGFDGFVRVIFCPFAVANPYFGSTHGGLAVDGFPAVDKFILINTSKSHTDQGTLLHELIHASIRGESLPHDEDNPRNVYSTALSGRDQLTEKRAAQLAAAYFR